MEIEDIIKKIGKENQRAKTEVADTDGLLRLQEVAALYDGEHQLIWSDDIVERLKDNPPAMGHKTGITELDDLTGGFREQQLITMFAHTKHGKTEVSMWMTSIFPELAPVVIPLEQNAEEIISQRLERKYEVPRFLSPLNQETFVTTDWIEQRVIEGIAKHNTKMLVIDHLGYIDNNGEDGKYKRENLAYRIGMVMKELKGIAKRWNVIIILLVHVSEGDEGKPPQLTDIGNSSDIKKESDTVIGIWRKNYKYKKVRMYENQTMLSVLANRRFGKNGNIGLAFNTETGNYESDHDWVKDMETIAKLYVSEEY
jgi:replicative DNA helicase